MAEAALCTVWGDPIPGREKQALNVYNEAMQYWAGLQQEGRIERFDVTVLTFSGGDVAGLLVVRGTVKQIASVRRSKEYQRYVTHGQLVASHVSIASAYVDEGLAHFMDWYQKAIEPAV
jgi:hypothetical protein